MGTAGAGSTTAERIHREALVFDVHAHAPGFTPEPARTLYRFVNRTTMPPDTGLHALAAGSRPADAIVIKAVGDPIVTRLYRGGAWRAVLRQLEDARTQTAVAGGQVVATASGLRQAVEADALAVVLGLEGADAIGRDVDNVDGLFELGVRVMGPIHMSDNQLGTTCLPWQRYIGPLPMGRRRAGAGLTALGRLVVDRAQSLGILVDVAHADPTTLLDITAAASRPVACTHTGARARQDFARFLSDDELRAVAGTGGVIGLWPYCHRGRGAADVADLVAHARHIAEAVGPEHVCIGTDLNGVPGLMAGYRGERDLPVLTAALLAGGFTEPEVVGILGGNALRVFASSGP
jgi:membrane dipeptidase